MTPPAAGAHRFWSVISNTGNLAGGRLMLAMLRFAATLVLVQQAGLERFGEFSLILSIVAVAEWVSDFGLTDVAVRQMAADPQRHRATISAFALSKVAQGLLAAVLMAAGMALAGYPAQMLEAGWIAGVAVLLYAGVQCYRVEFRARSQMGREVGAELLASGVFFAAIWLAAGSKASVAVLAGCYTLSRAVNLLACALLFGERPRITLDPAFRTELRVLARACVPLGLTGLTVAVYDSMEQVALSHASTSAEVGTFSFAMRVMMLALVVEQALATAAFPMLAAQWRRDRKAFVQTLQTVLDWGLLVGAAMFCGIHVGAHGLVALVKPDPDPIADVLRCLAWAIPARAAVALVGPMLLIAGQLSRAVWIPVVVVLIKGLALGWLAPRGALGAAWAFLIAEIGVGLTLNLVFCQYASGVWLRWWVALRIALAAVTVAVGARSLGLSGSLLHGLLASAAFFGLAALLGAVQMKQLQTLIHLLVSRRRGQA